MKATAKVFLYDNKIDLGMGQFGSVTGFRLATTERHDTPEAIKDATGVVYGYVHEVDEGIIDMLDAYYGLGVALHERVSVTVTLQGGVQVSAYMYECTHVEMA